MKLYPTAFFMGFSSLLIFKSTKEIVKNDMEFFNNAVENKNFEQMEKLKYVEVADKYYLLGLYSNLVIFVLAVVLAYVLTHFTESGLIQCAPIIAYFVLYIFSSIVKKKAIKDIN